MLTGFNFLNGRPPTQSIAGTCVLLQFQFQTSTDPNSTIYVIFPVRTCTAPYTRTCNFSDPGGLVAHGFQLFEQETTDPIDSKYLCPSTVSTLNLKGPKLHLFCHFFVMNLHCPTHAHVTFRTPEVWLLTGFNFLNRRPHTQSIAGTHARLNFQC